MTRTLAGTLAVLLLAGAAGAQTPAPPPITAPTADPAADADIVACATYLASDNATRMEMLAELDMMADEGGGGTSADRIAADLATECETAPDALVTDVLAAMAGR